MFLESPDQSSRNIRVDTLRGLACILLVMYHVVGNNAAAGLRLSDGFLREINDLLVFIRMPLFTVLSGFVYAYRPYQKGWKKFLFGKTRRLILPMLVVGTLFAIMQALAPGSNGGVDNWYTLHLIPHGHYWFSEALFIIFIVTMILEIFGVFRSKIASIILLIVAMAMFLGSFRMQWLAVSSSMYLFPFFLMGMYLYRFNLLNYIDYRVTFALLIGLVLVFLFFENEISRDKRGWQALAIGMIGCSSLLASHFKLKLLARIGVFSYSIYLFHVFFTAGSRIVWQRLGVDMTEFLFVSGILAGILGPIIVELVLVRYRYTRVLFLGKSAKLAKAG